MWIMKPTDKARGIGIFIINKLTQMKKWAKDTKVQSFSYAMGRDTHIVSKYIPNPFLIGGKKFDLRIYVLVTSWKPLVAYKHRGGFARFCAAKYSLDEEDIDNHYVHLTNVSIQKHGDDYSETNGGKLSIHSLFLYIESTRGKAVADKLSHEIDSIIVNSLRAVQTYMISDRHCFECYGYDVMIDDELKPWLIEVNASPSLGATTAADKTMKHELISDIIDIVMPNGEIE